MTKGYDTPDLCTVLGAVAPESVHKSNKSVVTEQMWGIRRCRSGGDERRSHERLEYGDC